MDDVVQAAQVQVHNPCGGTGVGKGGKAASTKHSGPHKRLAELGCRVVEPVLTASRPTGVIIHSESLCGWLRPSQKLNLVNHCEIFDFHLRPGGFWQARSR